MSLADRLYEYQQQEQSLSWEGSLSAYLDLVAARPAIARVSHARLNDMIRAAGVEETPDGPHYRFFDGVLHGADAQIRALMEYLDGAAKGLDVRRRILLLIGPPAGGKSTLLTLLKRGLEQYSRTPDGALYAIQGCPMHEEPLHLIPETLRPEYRQALGVEIEGTLCPLCQWRLDHDGLESFRVERLLLSEQGRVGIGTFVPGSEKDLEIDHLVGSLDFAKIVEYGSAGDPRAFRFDGELERANRGLMEMAEWLKLPVSYHYQLLSLAMERTIKVPRYANLYADEVVIAHANLYEFEKFVVDRQNEAMSNRTYVVHMPYSLRIADEMAIYQHMWQGAAGLRDTHVAPHTWRALALFTVLTRLMPAKDETIDLRTKAQLYNGDAVADITNHRLRDLQAEHPHEGLTGLSPRDALNTVAHALGRSGTPCVNAIDVLLAAAAQIDGGKYLGFYREQDKERLHQYRVWAREDMDRAMREDVQQAFVHAFADGAQAIFTNYLLHAEAWDSRESVPDPVTGEMQAADVGFLRQLEEPLGISETAAPAFRTEILKKRGAVLGRSGRFEWDTHPRLKEAITKKLFEDAKGIMVSTLSTKVPDERQQRRLAEVQHRLIAEKGYCEACARAAVAYTGHLLQQSDGKSKAKA